MLIEVPVLLEEAGVAMSMPMMIRVDKIESIVAHNGEECEMHTLSGDVLGIAMPYKAMIKYWHDALETSGGVYIAKVKEENVNLN